MSDQLADINRAIGRLEADRDTAIERLDAGELEFDHLRKGLSDLYGKYRDLGTLSARKVDVATALDEAGEAKAAACRTEQAATEAKASAATAHAVAAEAKAAAATALARPVPDCNKCPAVMDVAAVERAAALSRDRWKVWLQGAALAAFILTQIVLAAVFIGRIGG